MWKLVKLHLDLLSSSGESRADAQIFFYLYISCLIVSSCYTLIWDLKMDWGLFDRNAGENTFLREEIVYPHKVLGETVPWCNHAMWRHRLNRSFCVPAGLLLQRYCGGCAVTVFMDADYHPEHSGEVSWYGRHTGNFTGPHGGLQVLQQLIYIICCVFVTQTLVLHS